MSLEAFVQESLKVLMRLLKLIELVVSVLLILEGDVLRAAKFDNAREVASGT